MNIEQAMYVNYEAVHIALTMCCGGAVRYDLRRPFRQGRNVFATNGIIIARVPEWAAPWVNEPDYPKRQTPGCVDLPWAPDLYSNLHTPWPTMPKPIVPRCDACEETKGRKEDGGPAPSVWELCDFGDPQQICKSCGAYTASEVGADYLVGPSCFNIRQCRKLYTLGAVMFAPLVAEKDPLAAWRWEIEDLKMIGLLMPVKRGHQ